MIMMVRIMICELMPLKIISSFCVQNKIVTVKYESYLFYSIFLVIPILFAQGQEFVTNAFLWNAG